MKDKVKGFPAIAPSSATFEVQPSECITGYEVQIRHRWVPERLHGLKHGQLRKEFLSGVVVTCDSLCEVPDAASAIPSESGSTTYHSVHTVISTRNVDDQK